MTNESITFSWGLSRVALALPTSVPVAALSMPTGDALAFGRGSGGGGGGMHMGGGGGGMHMGGGGKHMGGGGAGMHMGGGPGAFRMGGGGGLSGADYGYAPDYWYDGGYHRGYGGYAGSPNIYYGGAPTCGGVTQEDRRALAEANAAAEESCNGLAPGVTDFPVTRIKQGVQPTGDQLTALNDLSAAAAKANDIIKASCPTAVPLTPVARLDTSEARLEAVTQAVEEVRLPLEAFYDSLSDEQKQRFENMGSRGKGQAPAGGDVAALCSQHSGDATNLPIQRIEQVVQPNSQQQQDAFAALKQASRHTADQLQASCPSQVPHTPLERLGRSSIKRSMQ
jgi:hypothetical protein